MEIKFGNYGQERDLDCTDEELTLFYSICGEFPNEDLRLLRVSNNYLTIRYKTIDVIRIKYTEKAKWIVFPSLETGQVKHYIENVEDWTDYIDQVHDCIEHAIKYEV